MNANNLPFMRSLHNEARPRMYLRHNHPTAGIMPARPVQPAISAGIAAAPSTRGGPAMRYATGGQVPTLEQLSQVDVTQPYPYDNGSSWAGLIPSRPVVPTQTAVIDPGPAPDPYATPARDYTGDVFDALGKQGAIAAYHDMQEAPTPKKKGFLGLSGKDWLHVGLGALSGLVGAPGAPIRSNAPAASAATTPSIFAPVRPVNYASTGFAHGGQINAGLAQQQGQQAQPAQDDHALILAAAAALAGQSQDPSAIQAFVQRFGQAELKHLAQMVQSGQLQVPQAGQGQQQAQQPQQPQQMQPTSGGLVQGPGDGTSDSVPAVHAPSGQPIALSGEEYIIPAADVSALGNGSSKAGAQKIHAGLMSLRKHKRMPKHGNPPNLGPNDNPVLGIK